MLPYSVVCPSVCPSFTLVHPAKPMDGMRCHLAGHCVVPSNTVLDRDPGLPTERRNLEVGTPSHNLHFDQTPTESRMVSINSLQEPSNTLSDVTIATPSAFHCPPKNILAVMAPNDFGPFFFWVQTVMSVPPLHQLFSPVPAAFSHGSSHVFCV